MRMNQILAIIFAAISFILIADLSLDFPAATGVVIDKKNSTSGSAKGKIYRYEAVIQTKHGTKIASLDSSTFSEVEIGTHIRSYNSALFDRTARVEFNGKTRNTTLNQAGTAVSISLVACLFIIIGSLTLPITSVKGKK